MLPCFGGGSIHRLSVTDGCRWLGGDGINMRLRVPESVVNTAHIPKELDSMALLGSCTESSKSCGRPRTG